MARILQITPQIPYPPRQGTALRNWGLLRGIAAHHSLSLLSFAAPDQPVEPPAPLAEVIERFAAIPQPRRRTADRLRALVADPRPDLALRLASPAFHETLRAWLAEGAFDWIQVEGLEMAPYLDALRTLARPPRVIFDDHNCEYLLQRRASAADRRHPARWPAALYSAIQWRRLRRYEAEICRRADLVVTVSPADARALEAIVPALDSLVVPNGLFVEEYATFEERAPLEQPAFVFTGTMDFRPNVDGVLWFAEEVWPRVRNVLPGAHFYVVGRHPHARLEPLREQPGIVITGAVPDTRPYIRAALVYVVPLLVGGGTRLKLLESSAMGKAIVSTMLGAEGFAAPGEAMVLADTPEDFAGACIALARDEEERARLAGRATTFARGYDWEALLPPLLERLATESIMGV